MLLTFTDIPGTVVRERTGFRARNQQLVLRTSPSYAATTTAMYITVQKIMRRRWLMLCFSNTSYYYLVPGDDHAQ